MRFDLITSVPGLLKSPFEHSIIKRSIEKGIVEIGIHDLRNYAHNKYRQVDDYAYGGGAGMVLMIEPISRCIEHLTGERAYDEIIYMSPDGPLFEQSTANELATRQNLILLCGHYKGIDERIREHLITREISIGNYVLSGGELAAAVITDAVVRLLPGAMGDETSALSDSYQDGLVAPPVYTRPAKFRDWSVPDILLSGHAAKIEEWRHNKAIERTQKRRPGLLGGPSDLKGE